VWNRKPYSRPTNHRVNRASCKKAAVCNEDCRRKCAMCGHCAAFCSDYSKERCEKLNHPPYVCDACDLVDRCPLEKFRHDPFYAQQEIDAQVTPLTYEVKFPFVIFSSYQRSFICIPHSESLHIGSPIFYSRIERVA